MYLICLFQGKNITEIIEKKIFKDKKKRPD